MPTAPTHIKSDSNPYTIFDQWFNDAQNCKHIQEPGAMCLSTVDNAGNPNARIVLMKEFNENGIVFFTNLESTKGQELAANHQAAVTFYWGALNRQVRLRGSIQNVSTQEADAYWSSRPRKNQVGSAVSRQSQVLDDWETYQQACFAFDKAHANQSIPRPQHWSGFRVVPKVIEFWEGQAHRQNHRRQFVRQDKSWEMRLLYP